MNNSVRPVIDALLPNLRELHPFKYRMAWRGTKVPRGAHIGNDEIMWTQHGMIRGSAT
jgi:hypothetical protein